MSGLEAYHCSVRRDEAREAAIRFVHVIAVAYCRVDRLLARGRGRRGNGGRVAPRAVARFPAEDSLGPELPFHLCHNGILHRRVTRRAVSSQQRLPAALESD